MNVCMLAYAHYVNDARIKSYVRTLEDNGHMVDVIALRTDGEPTLEVRSAGTVFRPMRKYQGQSIFCYLWSYSRFFFKALFLLTRRAFVHRYDVIHVHNMPNILVFAAIVPKLFGARVMLDVHDLMTVNYMAKFDAAEKHPAVQALTLEQSLSAMFANHVFCADHNQQDYLVDHCRLLRQKTTVLMNLPNVHLFKPVTANNKADLFRIVYHGTIAHRLGIDLILTAMAKVTEQIPATLWIYGSGDYLPDALALAKELGLQDRVHFSGTFFPVEKIPEFVSGMDLGIIGNRKNLACDKYMLPVKLLEYVYLGVPVVAPQLNVIRRYFDSTMVRFYEPENDNEMAEAIIELFHNKHQRELLARNARQFYQTHNIAAQASLYINALTGFVPKVVTAAGEPT